MRNSLGASPVLTSFAGWCDKSQCKDKSSIPWEELESINHCSSHPKNMFDEWERKTENLPYDPSTRFSYLGSQKARHLPPALWWTAITLCKPQRAQWAFPAHHQQPAPRDCRTWGVALALMLMLHAGQANFLSVLWLSTQHTTGVTVSTTPSKVT